MLNGRRALVTGAASGIGRATALRLAADGAAVAINHLPGGEEAAARVVEEAPGRAAAVVGDVSSEADVAAMFDGAEEALGGPVDVLVNNAGTENPFPLEEMPLEQWNRVLSVNLTGPFLCTRELARRLPPGGAVIVNVSSVHERIPWRRYAHYCASKAGLRLLTETSALELGPRGVRVVSVAPGAIVVERTGAVLGDREALRRQEEQTASGRLGRPEEVAATIAWLASDEASYVNGATVLVDDGMTLYTEFD